MSCTGLLPPLPSVSLCTRRTRCPPPSRAWPRPARRRAPCAPPSSELRSRPRKKLLLHRSSNTPVPHSARASELHARRPRLHRTAQGPPRVARSFAAAPPPAPPGPCAAAVVPAARPLRLPRPAPAPRRSSQPRRHRSAAPPAARRLPRPHFSPIQSHRSPHLVAEREREGSREREGRVTEVERRRSGMNWFGRFCRTNSSRILKEYFSFVDEFIPTFSNQTLQKTEWSGSVLVDSSNQTHP